MGKWEWGLLQVSSPFCDREAPASGAVSRFCWREMYGGWAGREQPVAVLQMQWPPHCLFLWLPERRESSVVVCGSLASSLDREEPGLGFQEQG